MPVYDITEHACRSSIPVEYSPFYPGLLYQSQRIPPGISAVNDYRFVAFPSYVQDFFQYGFLQFFRGNIDYPFGIIEAYFSYPFRFSQMVTDE